MSKIAIIIPARYGSTRFPGKPLAMIGGKTMLQRVCETAQEAAATIDDCVIAVATEDRRIYEHALGLGVTCLMTPADCPTGSDRALAAIEIMEEAPDFVVNLQGDAPFTPPIVLTEIIKVWLENQNLEVVTPVVQLSWEELDALRENKKITPFSGTTCIRDENGRALWFSKNIIPAIRKEEQLKTADDKSPVFQHLGIYGFRTDILKKFVSLPQSRYEKLEGLEQLRLLENGISVFTVKLKSPVASLHAGIDSPEDVERAEALLARM